MGIGLGIILVFVAILVGIIAGAVGMWIYKDRIISKARAELADAEADLANLAKQLDEKLGG